MRSDQKVRAAAVEADVSIDSFKEKLLKYHDVERKNFDLVRKNLSELKEKLKQKTEEYNSTKLAFDKANEEVELAWARVQRLISITDEECQEKRKVKYLNILQDQRVVGSLRLYVMKKNDKEVLLAAQHDMHTKKLVRKLASLRLIKVSDELKGLKDNFDLMKAEYVKGKEICETSLDILVQEEKNCNRKWEIFCTEVEDFKSRQEALEGAESDL